MTDPAMEMYLDPKRGYWGQTKQYSKLRQSLKNMYALQRHREVNARMKRKLYRHITAKQPFESVQIDLAFLPKLRSPLNHNIWGFIVVIDVFSRYLWIKTFTNRKALHVPLESVLQRMRSEFGKSAKNMTGDGEFATTKMHQLAAKYDFEWYFGDANEKFRTGISERVIRTIKNLIKRYLAQNNTTKYIDVLPDLIYNYNHTIHRVINKSPYDAITTGITHIKPDNKLIPELPENTKVRVLERRNKFTKGDQPYYGDNIFHIAGRDRNRYVLKNAENGTEIRKRYGRHQLLPINDVFKDKYVKNAKKSNDALGYDAGIAQNEARNRFNASMNRSGIEIDEIDDSFEQQNALAHQMSMDHQNESMIAEDGSDFGRIDDLPSKFDKFSVSKYSKMPTNGNGACLFNSIAGFLTWERKKQILKPGSSAETKFASFLRKQIVRYMSRNLNKKIPNLGETISENISRQLEDEQDSRSVNEYLNDMLKVSEWGGQSEIIVASMYLKRNILVYVKRGSKYEKHGGFLYDSTDNNLITLFWNQKSANKQGNHYEYLIRIRPSDTAQTSLPRRTHRIRAEPKQYDISQQIQKEKAQAYQNRIKILPSQYTDVDGSTANEWEDENVGQWVRDSKKKDGWLEIVKHNNELRYKGVYDVEEGDVFVDAPLNNERKSSKPSKESLRLRHIRKRKQRQQLKQLKQKLNNVDLINLKKSNNNLAKLIENL